MFDGRRRLALAWLVLALIAIGLSTLYAVVLVVARTPLAAALGGGAELFRGALVMHVDLAALIWFFAMAAALWSASGSPRRMALRWTAFAVAAAGVASIALAPLLAPAPALASNYVPVLESRLFLIGLAWFFAGIAAAALLAVPGLAALRDPRRDALEAGIALIALPTLLAAVSLLWSAAGLGGAIDSALYFELLSWAPGHIVQFAFTLLLMVAWLVLARAAGLPPTRPRRGVLLGLFALAAAPALLALPIHALYAPDGVGLRKAFTVLMAFGSWPAALVFGAWLALWLVSTRRAAGSLPRTGLWLSLLLFGVGCTLGAFIRADSTMIPAHYHGTVGAVTLALMSMALVLLPRLGFPLRWRSLAGWQPAVYGSGLMLMVAGLAWSGGYGAPRKTTYADWSLNTLGNFAATGLTGSGGLLAVAGSGLFVVLAAAALLRRPVPAGAALANDGLGLLQADSATARRPTPNRRGDARLRAIAFTGAAVVLLGLAIAWMPDVASPRAALDRLLAGFRPLDKASHVAERRREEVDRRFVQGVMMLHAKQYEHAVTAFHRVIELAPDMPEAHANMGFALLGLGRPGAARDFFNGALALRANQLNAYYGLAEALEALGDLPGAIGAMRTYAHLAAPDDPFRRKAEAALWEWQARGKQAAVAAEGAGRRAD